MIWEHDVSLEWLKARKEVLTATEIASLIPEMKRKKSGKIQGISPACAALWMEKHSDEDLITKSPSSAAARGHILEPYAVKEINRFFENIHHWDDAVIVGKDGIIAFSPDALNVRQACKHARIQYNDSDEMLYCPECKVRMPSPTKMYEIKSYSVANYTKKILTPAMDLDERYQIAVGMSVCPTIEIGSLAFYCPQSPLPIQFFHYHRDELLHEMEDVDYIVKMYLEASEYMFYLVRINESRGTFMTEREIHRKWLEETRIDSIV